VATKRLKAFRLGDRVLIDRDDADAFVESLKAAAVAG
jgi:hypothetical protein